MEIGLNLNRYEVLAKLDAIRELGVTWVKWGYDLFRAHDRPEVLAQTLQVAVAAGLQPVIDLRMNPDDVKGFVDAGDADDPYGRIREALGDTIREVVSQNMGLCTNWEWWGEPNSPHMTRGVFFSTFDYAESLRIVYEAAHEADPMCRVWTGGFGVNLGSPLVRSGMEFLKGIVNAHCGSCGLSLDPGHTECPKCERPLRAGVGKHFDVANLHPYIHGRDLGSMLAYHNGELHRMRELLDGPHCAKQPLASTEWGYPTVPVKKSPPWLRSYILSQGVQAICEGDAPAWFDATLSLFETHNLEVVCVHTFDDVLGGLQWSDFCGLRRRTKRLWWEYDRKKAQWQTVHEWAKKGAA